MQILSIPLLILGLLMFFLGGIWYLVASFQVSIWWGLAVLFIPFGDFFFLFVHWEEAKSSFKLILFALLLVIVAIIIDPSTLFAV